MAGRDPDIRLLIGAAMGGVDGDSEQQLRQDIQSIVTKLNRDPVRVFISLKAVGTSGKSLEDQIQAELDKISTTKKYTITVNKIDASSALKGFTEDLKSILKKISLTNVKFEVKDDGVAATVEDVGEAAKKAAADVAALEAKFNALKDAQKKTKAGWEDVGASLDSDGSVTTQTGKIVNLRQKYIDLNAAIDSLDDNSGMMNDAMLDDLFRQQAEVSRLIEQRKQQLIVEKAIANAEVKKQTGSTSKDNKSAIAEAAKIATLYKQVSTLLNDIVRKQEQWSAAANGGTKTAFNKLKDHASSLRSLLSRLDAGQLEGVEEDFADISRAVTRCYSEIRNADKATKSFGDKFKGLAEKFGSWLTVSQVIMEAVRAVRQMITNVVELDTAMTELRKVTDETESTYIRFLEKANERAKVLGATIKDTVAATADFARLGYTIDEASSLADAAMIYKNVGDGIEDISTASESIISTMKAFGIEAENAITIVDRFNITGNNFAISSKGVGDALVRSASALASANNTLNESIALITAGNLTVQDADRVGTTLKTVSMFLRAAKTEAEEAGESTDGMANSVSELRGEILALTGNKVDIQINENEFKSTYQILRELSSVWGELTDVSQANLLELIGGKRNSNVVASILQNFETAEEVLAKVGDSAGSAMEENEKYLESVAGHIAQFKATFEGLSSTLIDSETLVKNVVDAGISILEFLTKLAEGLDRVGSLTPVITSLFGTILTFNIGSATDKVTKFVKTIAGLPGKLQDIGLAFRIAHESAASGASAVKRYSDALAAAKVEASLLQVALGAVTAAITLGIIAWSAYQKKLEDARRAADDAADAAHTSIEYIDDQIGEISKLKTELEAESLSEQESYEKRKQLLAIQEELIEAYGHEAAGIDLVTASAEGANKALNDLAALQAQHVLDENFAAFDEATAKMQEVKDGWASTLGLNTYLAEDIIDRESVDRIYSDLEKIALGLEGVTIYRDDLNDIQNAYIKFGGTARQAEASAEAFGVALRELAQQYKTEGVYDQYILSGFFPSEEEISDKLGELYENTGKVLDEFAERYDSYIELKIRADVNLVAMEDGLANLSEKYADIINGASGGGQIAVDQIAAIRAELEAIKSDASDIEDTGIRDYLLGLIADVETKMASAPLVEKYVNDVSGFWIKAVRNAIAKFKDATGSVSIYDILNFDVDKGTEEQAAALNYLSMIARECGVSLEEALQQLSLFGEIDVPVDEVALTRSVETIEELMTKLSGVADEASSLIDAMQSLKEGTALTKDALVSLAEEYPALLEYSNLFTDGTVEGQQAMLESLLEVYEAEYDAHIDTKIAELRADNEALRQQIDIENEKLTVAQNIANMQVNGKLDAEQDYIEKVDRLRELELENYVTFADGVLDIHRDLQQKKLDLESDYSTNLGKFNLGDIPDTPDDWALQSASAYEQWLDSVMNSTSTIGNQSIDDWVGEFKDATTDRINILQETIERNNALIENLEAMKGLDLKSLYGDKGSSGSKVEEYVADLEDYYDALKRLSSIQHEIETIDLNIELAEDTDEKINLTQRLIALYREEGEALEHLTSLRKQTIAAGVEDLRSMGFQVEYNAEINELYISNLERLNELQATNIGKYDSMQDATNALRKDTETLIDSLESLNDANIDSAKSVVTLQQNIKDAKASIIEYLDEIVAEANDLVDGFQNAYSVLTDAAKEYASTGYLSVDSLQAILDLGPQYLSMLMTENGQLIVNEQSLQNVIAAKTEQMAAETALSYAKQVLLAVENNEIETLANLTLAATEASGATWDLAYATLGLAKSLGIANGMDESYFDTAISNISKMQSLTKTATSTISSYYQTLDESYINQKDALQQILEMTQDMIKWENEQQIEALEKEKDAYQEIIDKKKEILQLTKEEEDRDRSITEKLEQIAKLQARIDQLSLDDSREAKAQRAQLEEELHELKKDLADEQSEHALDVQLEALDKQAEANEENIDQQIDALKDMLGSAEKLYQAAISRISNGWDTLYRDLNNWNYNYGSTLQKDLVNAWNQASEAVQRYGSFVAALENVDGFTGLGGMAQTGGAAVAGNASNLISQMRQNSIGYLTATTDAQRNAYSAANVQLADQVGQLLGEKLRMENGYWIRGNGDRLYEISRDEAGRAVVNKMKQNSAKWQAASDSIRAQLEAQNEALADSLRRFLGVKIEKRNGVWYLGNQELYNVTKFHTGGIAGGEGTVKQDEVMAILKKGEPVLDEKREQGLYKIIDFTKYLSDKLGKVIDTSAFGRFFGNMPSVFPSVTRPELASSVSESMVFSPVVNVTVQHSGGMTDNEAKRFGSIAADSVLQELSEAFSRRGVSNIGNALLKH